MVIRFDTAQGFDVLPIASMSSQGFTINRDMIFFLVRVMTLDNSMQ
ncbi:hypothetical protein K6U44_16145 [Vibrio parahaemolyticus]|nr:hypothetical protein [Vibrio parahaemolyticus]MCG6461946.1 hypothetical protein [Vibrio parahaemolyticus]